MDFDANQLGVTKDLQTKLSSERAERHIVNVFVTDSHRCWPSFNSLI